MSLAEIPLAEPPVGGVPSSVKEKHEPAAVPEHLRSLLRKYRRPDAFRATWQLVNTLVPLAVLWWGAWVSVDYHYALTLLLCLPIAGLMVRSFVLHHDCSHGSFYKSRRVNGLWGFWLGMITLTPFHRWRRSHNIHHAHSGDLDHRGGGYITLYTLREYEALPLLQRCWYRFYRHPLTLFILGPLIQFVILERLSNDLPPQARVARSGVWKANLVIVAFLAGLYLLGGWGALARFAMIYFPASAVASGVGVWLFFVQHNYEHAYFKRHAQWDFTDAALDGSSFYDLPGWLHFFSANIGFHHIHHLDCMIPNYNLPRCHYENREFQTPHRITLWGSLQCLGLDLWDEDQQRMVPFSAARPRNA